MRRARLIEQFPGLARGHFRMTSPIDKWYNCFAHAAGESRKKWHPEPLDELYWPPGAPRGVSVAEFTAAYALIGYTPTGSTDLEPGVEKIALYVAENGEVAHAARQLSSGLWTSKMGKMEDIEHELEGLEGTDWGPVSAVLARATDAQIPLTI